MWLWSQTTNHVKCVFWGHIYSCFSTSNTLFLLQLRWIYNLTLIIVLKLVIRPFTNLMCLLVQHGAKDQLTSVGLSSRCRGLWGECVHDSLVGLRTCDVSVSYMEHLPGTTTLHLQSWYLPLPQISLQRRLIILTPDALLLSSQEQSLIQSIAQPYYWLEPHSRSFNTETDSMIRKILIKYCIWPLSWLQHVIIYFSLG